MVLINLGTPDSPSVQDVRKYLSQFLNDPRVIDVPWLWRKLLVNAFIVPFRAPKSAKVYRQLWTGDGSPLKVYGYELANKLQERLGPDFYVDLAMRYQNPSIRSVLESMREQVDRFLIVPLYPQYASSSTGSTIEEVLRVMGEWWTIPETTVIDQFYDREKFIEAIVEKGRQYDIDAYDHVLFSYHGLPERQVDKVHPQVNCDREQCRNCVPSYGKRCYLPVCYETTRFIAQRLGIPEEKYSVGFQSRLNDKWLKPFSDELVREKAREGCERLLVFSPAFVADCLETTIEIGVEYQELFEEHGGKEVQLVESLNASDTWVACLEEMVLEKSGQAASE